VTVILSGFADEISDDPGEQLAVLAAESIAYLELRSAWSVNVADFTDRQVAEFRKTIGDAGVAVSAVGSPVGKIDIGAPFAPELERMRRVADIAGEFGTAIVRVFSFYLPDGEPPERYRSEVIDRMGALAGVAEVHGLVLAHENEKMIYGDVPERCADIVTSVGSPALRATFDAGNFVQCGVRPFTDAYPLIRPHLVYAQVKDARFADGEVTAAGEGDGEMRPTLAALRDSGFEGFLSLEPHLALAGRRGGFSGPDEYRRAVRALKSLLEQESIPWQ
jgi:sugar phosphate isomerase/epimerase